jgi:hypothetical protein
MFEEESIDSQRVAVIGIFTAVVIFIIIIGVQVLFYRVGKQDVVKKDSGRPRDLAEVMTEQQSTLNTYRWVDRDTNTVTIPIKRAMQLEVENLAGVRQ